MRASSRFMLVGFCLLGTIPVPSAAQTLNDRKVPPVASLTNSQPSVVSPEKKLAITNSEKLFIRVNGSPELSGEYRLNADETISIPLIGRISVANLTAEGLETVLSKRASSLASREVSVTVETVLYKPVFVVGSVDRSGAQQWGPGMTVLQALALAGGIDRTIGTSSRSEGLLVSEVARLEASLYDLKSAMAKLARLRAERENRKTIETPRELIEIVGGTEAERLISQERTILLANLSTREAKLATNRRARELAAQELDGLNALGNRVAQQLMLRQQNSRKLNELQSRGVVVASRSLDEQVRVSELEEKSANVAVSTARIYATIAGLEREADTLVHDRNAELDNEIARVDRDIAHLQIQRNAAKSSELKLAGDTSANSPTRRTVFRLVRVGEGGERSVMDVNEAATLQPGDVLLVSQE